MGLTDRDTLVEKFGLHRKYEKEWMDLRNTDVEGYLEQYEFVRDRFEQELEDRDLAEYEVRDNRDSIVLKPTGPLSASSELLVVEEDDHDSQYDLGIEIDPRSIWLTWDEEPSTEKKELYRAAESVRQDWAAEYGFESKDVSIADPGAIHGEEGIDHFRKDLQEYDV